MPYYPDRFIEAPEDEYTKAEWLERIGDQRPAGDSFNEDGSTAALSIEVPWNKARSFLRFVLGWSYVESASATNLVRENPQPHPRFPTLYASGVQFQGEVPVGVEGVGTKVDGIYGSTRSLPVAKYRHEVATVTFTSRPYYILSDLQLAVAGGYEYYRNTYFDPVPSIEIISAEGLNNLQFKYNTGPGEQSVPAPFGTLVAKCTQTLNWMRVPHEFINGSNQYNFLPGNILASVGTVNSADWFGFPANTVLMQPPVFVPHEFVIPTADGVSKFKYWDIKLPFQYFKPVAGTQSGVPGGTVFAGHQLLPWREDLKWYPAVRQDGTSKVYPETDFATIFTRFTG